MNNKPLKVIAGAADKPLLVGDIQIGCYVLEDETRVISQTGMASGLGMARASMHARQGLPVFLASKTLTPYVSNELVHAMKTPIIFKNPSGGGNAYGYPATILVDICEAVLTAKDAGVLTKQQKPLADRCNILTRGFARVGIIGLVDEVTGYQRLREERALATILEKFISKELQPWTKTFPYEFYEQIFRLRGWPGPDGVKRPSVIGTYTNDFIYSRLAHGVLDELKKRTPKLPSGKRKHRYFQWFTPDIGHPKLKEHLAAVTALMRASPNWTAFKRNLQTAFPKENETMQLPLDD